ncbi:gas vesicle protein [Streptomyces spiralis]|uniref:Gas vesicle protein n=1 Tax=Streptomyces spiralis TaxID=66376 RepID=A0A919DSB1_9ACTN|nr:gas vesicle protein [Streptomyces spiralis]GHE71902.1 gas vesicle protein [Streptomyces spiralis]
MANKDDTAHDPAHESAHDTAKPKHSQKTQQPQESQEPQEPRTNSENDTRANDHGAAPHRPRPMEVLREARAQFEELTGMTAESVTTFVQTEDGWSLEVEVLELARVPDTMSLMASYQVELDTEGQLTGYRRARRYERGRSEAHRSGGR